MKRLAQKALIVCCLGLTVASIIMLADPAFVILCIYAIGQGLDSLITRLGPEDA